MGLQKRTLLNLKGPTAKRLNMGRWKNSLSKRSYLVAVQTEPPCLPWFLQGSYENPTREMLQKLWHILRHSCHMNLSNLGKLRPAHTGQDYKRKKVIICFYLDLDSKQQTFPNGNENRPNTSLLFYNIFQGCVWTLTAVYYGCPVAFFIFYLPIVTPSPTSRMPAPLQPDLSFAHSFFPSFMPVNE